MDSSIVAPTMGPALFHRAQLRFKKLAAGAASNAVATRGDSATESSAPSDAASDDGLSQPSGSTSYVPFRPYMVKSAPVVRNGSCESVSSTEEEQLPPATAAATGVAPMRGLSPLPDCLRLHPNADRIRDDKAAIERDHATSTLDRLKQSVRQLQSAQQFLNQALSQHVEDDQDYREAQCAREVVAAEERVAVAELKVAHKRKKADAQRLEERIVAEVVPLSADGRAQGDVAAIRRLAAPRAARQMIADSSYPRF